MEAAKIASSVGLRDPAAKGAMVRGTRPTDTSLGNVSLYHGTKATVELCTSQKSSGSFRALASGLAQLRHR